MKQDRTINPNWTTLSTMATMYTKMGQIEKAEDCLKNVKSRITGWDRIPYHYLISLYRNVGNKEEAYRVWKIYKTIFPGIPNLAYHAIISSLVRLGHIEGVEKIYDKWLQVKSSFDPRITNLLMGWYVKEGNLDKAESFFNHMVEGEENQIQVHGKLLLRGILEKGGFLRLYLAGKKLLWPRDYGVGGQSQLMCLPSLSCVRKTMTWRARKFLLDC